MRKPVDPRKGFSEEASDYRAASPRVAKPVRLSDGTTVYTMRVGPKGRVLLPSDLRAAMNVAEGDLIVGSLKEGVLRIETQRQAIRNIQEQLPQKGRGKSLVDELIAERREAANRGE
jgi:bifunctional DNA-binding transcriptional regulator/antitoxin component of YhaV-PrlF toxin-antitoxin module